jgi:hypothetical protein
MKWISTWLIMAMLVLTTTPNCRASDFGDFDRHLDDLEKFLAWYTPPHTLDAEKRVELDGGMGLYLSDLRHLIEPVDQVRRARALAVLERIFSERYGSRSPANALRFLNDYNPTRARELAYGGILDSNALITRASAAVLLEGGEWDVAAPILDSLGDFGGLTSTKDPRAIRHLRYTIETTDDPDRSVSAAYYLGYVYNEWDTSLTTARRQALQNRDELSNSGRLTLLKILQNGTTSEDVMAISRFLDDTQGIIAREALEALGKMTMHGVPAAETTLLDLAETGSEETKARAKRFLKHLKEMEDKR